MALNGFMEFFQKGKVGGGGLRGGNVCIKFYIFVVHDFWLFLSFFYIFCCGFVYFYFFYNFIYEKQQKSKRKERK